MAIIDALPGLKVSIESQGKALPEYEDANECVEWARVDKRHDTKADKRSSAYVECISDASFKIVISIEPPFTLSNSMLKFEVKVDGHSIGRLNYLVKQFRNGRFQMFISESYTIISATQVSRKAFKFTSITKVDNVDASRVETDAEILSSGLGEITIWAFRCLDKLRTPHAIFTVDKAPNAAPSEIAEKALKGRALSHGIGFGEERLETRAGGGSQFTYIDGRKNPFAMFRFKYRSREALQQELIIPRSPSPELDMSTSTQRSNNSNPSQTREERVAQLQREIDLIKAEAGVKDENGESQACGAKRSLEDASSSGRAYKMIRNSEGLPVIDLSDD